MSELEPEQPAVGKSDSDRLDEIAELLRQLLDAQRGVTITTGRAEPS